LLIGLAIVPLSAFVHLRNATLRAFDRVATALAPDHVLRHLIVVLVVGVMVYGFGYQLTPASAVTVLLLATLASLAMMTASLRAARPTPYYETPALHSREDMGSWRRMASSMFASMGAERLITETPLLILGALLDPKAVALYAIASRCAGLISFGLMAFNTIFAPTVARLHTLGKRHELRKVVILTTWMMLTTSITVAIPMFVLAEYVLAIFGSAFAEAADVLRLLIIAHLIKGASGQVAELLKMTGHERYVAYVLVVVAIVNLSLSVTLVVTMGVIGAAISTILIILIWNGIFLVAAWRRLWSLQPF
jgi:O-antigen/teichoic acid export membrane protein